MLKLIITFILSLGLLSCNNSKEKLTQTSGLHKAENKDIDTTSNDTLCLQLEKKTFTPKDSIITYNIINNTQWNYIYLADEYWIEHFQQGKWMRLPRNFGSLLMGKYSTT